MRLCIGGYHDGKMVDNDNHFVRLPAYINGAWVVEQYTEVVFRGLKESFALLAIEGMSADDVMTALIKHYKAKRNVPTKGSKYNF